METPTIWQRLAREGADGFTFPEALRAVELQIALAVEAAEKEIVKDWLVSENPEIVRLAKSLSDKNYEALLIGI